MNIWDEEPTSDKFDTRVAELLYEEGFGPSEEVGSVQEMGWYGLYRPDPTDPDEWLPEDVILHEDSQGFVWTITGDVERTIEQKWQETLDDYDDFYKYSDEEEEEM